MSKSVFQQLVEQTCSNANFKPNNNKVPRADGAAPANGSTKSVGLDNDPLRQKPAQSAEPRPHQQPATSNQQPKSPPTGAALLLAKQIRDMDAANRAPRCQHIRANGVRCASPAMRELPFCFFHEKFYNPPYDDSFPPLEDANSVQCAILQVLNGLKTKAITPLEARVMLYGLKAASINSRRTTFEPIMEAQVTEYPGLRRQPKDSSESVRHPESSEGPAVDLAAQVSGADGKDGSAATVPPAGNYIPAFEELFPLVKEQSSAMKASATASPLNSPPDQREGPDVSQRKPPSTDVIPSERSTRVEGPASASRAGQGFNPDKNGSAKKPSASNASPPASARKQPEVIPSERQRVEGSAFSSN